MSQKSSFGSGNTLLGSEFDTAEGTSLRKTLPEYAWEAMPSIIDMKNNATTAMSGHQLPSTALSDRLSIPGHTQYTF
jgi:hypothetical protein